MNDITMAAMATCKIFLYYIISVSSGQCEDDKVQRCVDLIGGLGDLGSGGDQQNITKLVFYILLLLLL